MEIIIDPLLGVFPINKKKEKGRRSEKQRYRQRGIACCSELQCVAVISVNHVARVTVRGDGSSDVLSLISLQHTAAQQHTTAHTTHNNTLQHNQRESSVSHGLRHM